MLTPPMPDDNYARQTNHDYIGSFGRIPNEPKSNRMKYHYPQNGYHVIWQSLGMKLIRV